MRVCEAQAIHPPLTVIDANEDRDAAIFEAIVDGLDDVASSIEVLRPGLVAVNLQAAANYHGSEELAASMLVDAGARIGVDSFAGVADEIPTAIIAARASAVVAVGQSAKFLAAQPTNILRAEAALGCDEKTVRAFEALGLHTMGDLAALSPKSVATRFGREGLRCLDVACGVEDRLVAPALAMPDFAVTMVPEEPIVRVDEAAFAARHLAARLHEKLQRVGMVCQRLTIVAAMGEKELKRTWRTAEPLSEENTAQRVRWQLDGWLSKGNVGAVDALTLEPECSPAQARELWGVQSEETMSRVVAQVQSTLGTEAVVQPYQAGGRGVADRIRCAPYGEQVEPDTRQWVGAMRGPLPASIRHPAARVRLLAQDGGDVRLIDAMLASHPTSLRWGGKEFAVTGWAGPWPVDDAWWRGGEPCVRLQVTTEGPRGWLLVWAAGQWRLEAEY